MHKSKCDFLGLFGQKKVLLVGVNGQKKLTISLRYVSLTYVHGRVKVDDTVDEI